MDVGTTSHFLKVCTLLVIFTVAASFVKSDTVDCTSTDAGSDVCLTSDCVNTASIIMSYIDPENDPCDNFYSFACGGYIKNMQIPDDYSILWDFTTLDREIQRQLELTLAEPSLSDELRPIKLLKTFYATCMNQTAIEAAGLEPIFKLLNQVGEWPILVGDDWDEGTFDWKEALWKLPNLGYPYYYFLGTDLHFDEKNNTKRVLQFSPAAFGTSAEYLIAGLDGEITKAYFDFMVDIAVILGVDEQKAIQDLRESLEFEIKLANLTLSDNEESSYNPMTVAELNEQIPGVDWKEYINNLLSPYLKVDDTEIVFVRVPNYMKGLVELLNTITKTVQANYLWWRIVLDSIEYTTEEVFNRQFEFYKLTSGETKRKPRSSECYDLVSQFLLISVDALYVRKLYDQEAKPVAGELMEAMKNEFTKIIEQTEWLNDATKTKALRKIAALYLHVAYESELLDDNILSEFHASLEFTPDDFFENSMRVYRFTVESVFRYFNDPVNRTEWFRHSSNVVVVNAFSNIFENSIEIPAAILQGNFFGKDRPQYLNYGQIGNIISHAILQGYNEEGRRYDEIGNVVDWWDVASKDEYSNRSECFVNQYNNYRDESVGLNVSGTTTLDENVADNGAFKTAYYAYMDYVNENGPELRLPGLNYTQNQLFWIGAANNYCAKYRPEVLKDAFLKSVYSPVEFRIIGSFSNRPEFSADFNCPTSSAMNRAEKCSVW